MATNGKANLKEMTVPGYGKPRGSDYPNIDKIDNSILDANARYSRDDLNVCETINNGYMFYVIDNAIFAKDISGYFYKLNRSTKQFEWFSDGWLEENEYSIGVTLPCPPTYISFNKDGYPVFPMNDDKPGKPILPTNEKGEKVFPIDPETGHPLFPLDFHGEPCFPVDDNGKPIFPKRPDGRPLVPLDSQGVAVFPRDVNGKVMFPEREDGRPVPPCTIYGNAIVPFKENGEPDLPVDSQGNPLILLGGDDGMTPMTEEEYQQWQCTAAIYGQNLSENYYAEMAHNEQALEAYRNSYYGQYYPAAQEASVQQDSVPSVHPVVLQNKAIDTGKEKERKYLTMQFKSFKKSKGFSTDEQSSAKPAQNEEKRNGIAATLVPSNRPPLPNKERERGERYIPESIPRRRREPSNEQRYDDRRIGYVSPRRNRDDNNRSRLGRGDNNGSRMSHYSQRGQQRRRSPSSSSSSPFRLRQERQHSSASSRSRTRSRSRSRTRGNKRVRRSSSSRSRSRSRSATYSDAERANNKRRQRSSPSSSVSSEDDSRRRHRKNKRNNSEKNKKRKRPDSSSSDSVAADGVKRTATEEVEKAKSIVIEDEESVADVVNLIDNNNIKESSSNTQVQQDNTSGSVEMLLKSIVSVANERLANTENHRLNELITAMRVERAIERSDFNTSKNRFAEIERMMLDKEKLIEGCSQREDELRKTIESLQQDRASSFVRISMLEADVERYQKIVKEKDEKFAEFKREMGYMLISENERTSRICREERESMLQNTMRAVDAKYGPVMTELKVKCENMSSESVPRKNAIRRKTTNCDSQQCIQKNAELLEEMEKVANVIRYQRVQAEQARNDCDEILRHVQRCSNVGKMFGLTDSETSEAGPSKSSSPPENQAQ